MEDLITIRREGVVRVIHLSFNELNLEQREILKSELTRILDDNGIFYVVDLSKVGFLSSLAIALIVFFTKEVHARDGKIKLSGLSSEAFSVIQLTQLDKIFEIYDTEHDALESFKDIA